MSQMEMVDLNSLLPSTHPYRRFQAYLPDASQALAEVSQIKGADGYGVERVVRCLLLQFMEDLSDRELERYLEEHLAAKWFCGFTLSEPTPDYSLFTRVRTRIGPTRLSQLFATMRKQLNHEEADGNHPQLGVETSQIKSHGHSKGERSGRMIPPLGLTQDALDRNHPMSMLPTALFNSPDIIAQPPVAIWPLRKLQDPDLGFSN